MNVIKEWILTLWPCFVSKRLCQFSSNASNMCKCEGKSKCPIQAHEGWSDKHPISYVPSEMQLTKLKLSIFHADYIQLHFYLNMYTML